MLLSCVWNSIMIFFYYYYNFLLEKVQECKHRNINVISKAFFRLFFLFKF